MPQIDMFQAIEYFAKLFGRTSDLDVLKYLLSKGSTYSNCEEIGKAVNLSVKETFLTVTRLEIKGVVKSKFKEGEVEGKPGWINHYTLSEECRQELESIYGEQSSAVKV